MIDMRPILPITISVLLLGGCQPDPSKVTIICSSDAPGQCPEGQQCLNGKCGVSVPDDAASPSDLGSDAATPQPDMAVSGCKTAIGVSIADQAACNSVAGFFAADIPAYWMGTMSQETCGTAGGNQLFYGCGGAGRVGVRRCGGLPRVLDLLEAGWTSSNGTLMNAANTQASQGVLCCKAGFKAVGCPGAFARGEASNQCAAGWAPCQTLP